MTKERILAEFKRATAEAGEHPSQNTFSQIVPESKWKYYWPRFSALVIEAGHEPRKPTGAHTDKDLIEQFIPLVRRLQRMPTKAEHEIERRSNAGFPSVISLARHFGGRGDIRAKIREYCAEHPQYDDVVAYLRHEQPDSTPPLASATSGYVYLIQSGKRYKIGRSNNPGRRGYEIGLQLPDRHKTVHVIETDDPEGIENYWHRRFASKRGNGEWFTLNAEDVAAFKRRKKFM